LLQSIDRDQQFGSLENFHQFVENSLVVLGSGLKIFLKYTLRFTNGLKRQLLISHCPSTPEKRLRINTKVEFKPNFGVMQSTFVSAVDKAPDKVPSKEKRMFFRR
jgi:hypothetical protein